MAYVKIDDKFYWKIDDPIPQMKPFGRLASGDKILESDTCNRADFQPIKEENWEEAEKNKVMLEDRQRADKKLRIAAQKRIEQT